MNTEIMIVNEATVSRANEIRIVDQLSLDWANDIVVLCKSMIDKVNAEYKPEEDRIKRETVELRSRKAADTAIPEQVKKYLDPKVARYLYDERQKKLKAEAEAKAQADAKKKLADDLRLAEEAEKSGHAQAADAIIEKAAVEEKAIPAAPVYVPPAVKAKDQNFRDNWKARVIDQGGFFEAVRAGRLPMNAILPNLPVLNELSKKEGVEGKHPELGLEYYNEPYTVKSRTNGGAA
jgi:hypothetical protein